MLRHVSRLLLPRAASSTAPRAATAPGVGTSSSMLTPFSNWLQCQQRHMTTMKRRFRGLYGGKHIQFGNTVSFSHRKARRTWKPNVQRKRFFSELYQRMLGFQMTTSVIKQVKKLAGGIDEYLLTTPNKDLLYPKAIKMKRNMRSLMRIRERDAAIAAMTEGSSAPAVQEAAAPSP